MNCSKPNIAYILGTKENGKNDITFSFNEAVKVLGSLNPPSFTVPCGHCDACKKRKCQDMTVRLMKENDFHKGQSCFITLTYNDEHMPFINKQDGTFKRGAVNDEEYIQSLFKHDIQAFLKRLRRQIQYHYGIKYVRFAVAGEYGKKHIRPHWHLIIFGWLPSDTVVHEDCGGYQIYRSKFIEDCWRENKQSLGFVTVGCGNGAVARYCAKYITKDGVAIDEHQVKECFWTSKQKGGIGYPWFNEFYKEVLNNGFVLSLDRKTGKAFKYSIPKYFISALERIDEQTFKDVKERFKQFAIENNKHDDAWWINFWHEQEQKRKVYRESLKRELRRYEDSPLL